MAPKCLSYRLLRRRMRRSLFYGNQRMNHLSVPANEAARLYFEKNCPYSYLDDAFAHRLSREACVNPSSLVIALIYLERVRQSDDRASAEHFLQSDANHLYLSALVVASKYLHDEGDDDFVYNDEWASSAGVSKRHLNELELEMLDLLGWRLQVTDDEFSRALHDLERCVAWTQYDKRRLPDDQMTYAEIDTLSAGPSMENRAWTELARPLLAVIACSTIAYTATVLSMVALGVAVQHQATRYCSPNELMNVRVVNDYNLLQTSTVTPLDYVYQGVVLCAAATQNKAPVPPIPRVTSDSIDNRGNDQWLTSSSQKLKHNDTVVTF